MDVTYLRENIFKDEYFNVLLNTDEETRSYYKSVSLELNANFVGVYPMVFHPKGQTSTLETQFSCCWDILASGQKIFKTTQQKNCELKYKFNTSREITVLAR